MIDCTKTTNYFNEKLKMTKRTKNGLCEIKCGNCPLSSKNNGKVYRVQNLKCIIPKRRLRLYRGGATSVHRKLICPNC